MSAAKTDESLEISAKGVKAPLGFIIRTFFPEKFARGEAVAALTASATDKVTRGELLSPAEAAIFGHVMTPVFEKATRVHAIAERADQILANKPKLLPPAQGSGQAQLPKPPWRERFFEAAGLSSEDDVTEMWARILAGEVSAPGSFSFKTLSVLRDTDQATATAFVKICGFIVDDCAIPRWEEFREVYERFGFRYEDLLRLTDGHLVGSQNSAFHPDQDGKPFLVNMAPGFVVRAATHTQVPIYFLTRAGGELAHVVDRNCSQAHADALRKWACLYLSAPEIAIGRIDSRQEAEKLQFRLWEEHTLDVSADGARFASPAPQKEGSPPAK